MVSFTKPDALTQYTQALERMISNTPVNVPVGTEITRDNVALEAGNKKGSLRERPGFEDLVRRIDSLGKDKIGSLKNRERSKKTESVNNKLREENYQLKRERDVFASRYLSLLQLNFQMSKQLERAGIKNRTLEKVVDFNSIADGPET